MNNLIVKFNEKHNYEYDYDYSQSIYQNLNSKIKITCPTHGTFEQRICDHLKGSGCSECKGNKKHTKETFIEKSNLIHGEFDYSLVEYLNNKTKVKIICNIHGIFEQRPDDHLRGKGCLMCYQDKDNLKIKFIEKSNKKHNHIYDYSLVDYINSYTKVKIICTKHGIFYQIPNNHLKHGCPICKESEGEKTIRNYLNENNIDYVYQKEFDECKNIKNLKFDFYLTKYNILIEYNGKQHYQPIDYFGGEESYEKSLKRDRIKKDFCKKNNIKLIIVKFNEKIEKKLKNIKL